MTPGHGSELLSISVVIPTLDAEQTLARTLKAVLAQEVPPGTRFEVIVSDDGSGDFTVAVARGFGEPVRVVEGPRKTGPGAARNRGAAVSMGDVLIFLDSDDVPLAGWLRQAAQAFDGPNIGLATWPAIVRDAEKGITATWTPQRFGPEGILALQGCFAVRRAVFEDVGGYDPILRFGENSDLCNRVQVRCKQVGLDVVCCDWVTVELAFNQPAAHYDRFRLEAIEYLLERDADRFGREPNRRSAYLGIAAVNAARCEEWPTARRHAWHSVRVRPSNPRGYVRLAGTIIPPLGRRMWSRSARRRRFEPD